MFWLFIFVPHLDDFNLSSVENCGTDNVITIDPNFTADLSSDCMLISKGCMDSKGYKKAKVCKNKCITSKNTCKSMVKRWHDYVRSIISW